MTHDPGQLFAGLRDSSRRHRGLGVIRQGQIRRIRVQRQSGLVEQLRQFGVGGGVLVLGQRDRTGDVVYPRRHRRPVPEVGQPGGRLEVLPAGGGLPASGSHRGDHQICDPCDDEDVGDGRRRTHGGRRVDGLVPAARLDEGPAQGG
jgi:hypothetical protein